MSVPVNVLASGQFSTLARRNFAEMGAARLSIGAALARVAYGAAIDVASGMLGGDFSGLSRAIDEDDINKLLIRNNGD